MIGGGENLPQLVAGGGAADGDVDVRGEAPLGFDGGEVLQVVAEEAAQVLDEPVEQRREMQRVPGGPLVVVGLRISRDTVGGRLCRSCRRSASGTSTAGTSCRPPRCRPSR